MAIDHGGLAALLADWLPHQRWFGGKGRPVSSYDIETDEPLLEGDPALHALVLAVSYADGGTERYQLLLGARGDQHERLEHAAIGLVADTLLYDAGHDPELTGVLLARIAESGTVGSVRFGNVGEPIDPTLPSRVLGNEQSNTSLVFGDEYILKVFRKLGPGVNPDLEITRALAEVGCQHIAKPLGWYEGVIDGESATLGLMQEFLRFGTDGWALALISVRDLYAEGDLHADEVGGDFAGEAERLGQATAEVHRDLARAFPTGTKGPTELTSVSGQMRERLAAACAIVPELRPYAAAIDATYEILAGSEEPMPVQRIHGDLHLGQVMRTETGWVLLDFEGEPARSLAERRVLASPLRDVAGMLRSFEYAARHMLMERPGQQHLEYRAVEWAERNRQAFCDGYTRGGGRDPRGDLALLSAFELDKAVYEVVYEARNRPSWLQIPLGTIERLAG